MSENADYRRLAELNKDYASRLKDSRLRLQKDLHNFYDVQVRQKQRCAEERREDLR